MRSVRNLTLIGGGLAIAVGLGQAQTGAATRPEFEVASIKPNNSNSPVYFKTEPGGRRFIGRNMTTKFLIEIAYQIKDFPITGEPSWISSEGFDIEAVAERPATAYQMQLMAAVATGGQIQTDVPPPDERIFTLCACDGEKWNQDQVVPRSNTMDRRSSGRPGNDGCKYGYTRGKPDRRFDSDGHVRQFPFNASRSDRYQ